VKRKRKHIPMIELLASILADSRMPPWERQSHRVAMTPAKKIVSLFTPDHVELHAWGGKDKWWNLTMTRRGPELFAKDRQDTSRAAKAKRIDALWGPFMAAMAKGRKPPKRVSRWPKRKMRT
jgi:hypothetical protein